MSETFCKGCVHSDRHYCVRNWAVYNRLFTVPINNDFGYEESTGTLILSAELKYYVGKPAELLLQLIEKAREIMDYQ